MKRGRLDLLLSLSAFVAENSVFAFLVVNAFATGCNLKYLLLLMCYRRERYGFNT